MILASPATQGSSKCLGNVMFSGVSRQKLSSDILLNPWLKTLPFQLSKTTPCSLGRTPPSGLWRWSPPKRWHRPRRIGDYRRVLSPPFRSAFGVIATIRGNDFILFFD